MEVADEGVRRQGSPPPPPPPPDVVVAVTACERGDSPAVLRALTRKVYAVDGSRPVTVAVVPDVVCTRVPSRWTAYEVAPGTADQDRETLSEVTAVAVRPVGAAGGWVGVPPPGPTRVRSSAW
ncbi:hypothetical protein GCM10020256_19460 [Streptomyces thermocoprophilus]